MVRVWIPPLLLIALCGCPKGLGKGLGNGGASGLLAPSQLSARARGGSEIELSWSDRSSGESGYRVEWSSTGFASGRPGFELLPADAVSFVYPTAPNRTHSFRVFAVTASFESDPSEIVTVTTPDVPDRPMLRAETLSTTGVGLAWGDLATESGYRVEMSEDGGGTWYPRTTLPANAVGTTVAPLLHEIEFGFRVIAFNANGSGTPSHPEFAQTLSPNVLVNARSTVGDVGAWPALAIDSDGISSVAHYDVGNGDVLLTRRVTLTDYVTTRIDTGPHGTENVGADGVGLALDRAGKVHVVAHDLSNDSLRYATNVTGTWTATTVDAGPGPTGARPRIVCDSTGTLHAYYLTLRSGVQTQIQHGIKSSSPAWDTNGALPVGVDPASRFGVGADGLGRIHLSLVTNFGKLFYHGELGGAGNFLSVGEPGAGRVDDTAIVVDSAGAIHVFYHDKVERGLFHVTNAGGSWATESVDRPSGRDVGAFCSAAIDPATGRLHLAYRDASRGDLRYARKDPGGPWVRRVLDAPGELGNGISIALDATGNVYVAYRDDTNGDLKMATGSP
jgi:catechol 2,3-dioxygenase-like lactoylglutathione lyase family enzyme